MSVNLNSYTIADIKRQDFNLPKHWVQDWLSHSVQKPTTFLISNSDYQLSPVELARFNAGIDKMQAGTPLAYLIGKQEFWSLEFVVNEHTLIPRPDTEVLVEQVLEWIKRRYNKNSLSNKKDLSDQSQLLDLGTGTGCIAISLAHELQQLYKGQWQVTALDYSIEALKVAQQNITLNHVTNISLMHSNWYGALATTQLGNVEQKPQFDVIVSNPPYIVDNDEHLRALTAEPISALVADDNGLADIKTIISDAVAYLKSDGLLAIEHGYDQGESVRQLFKQYGFSHVKTTQDYGNNDRVTMGENTPSDRV